MPISGVKSSFPEFGILAVQKRELIIEEVHNITICFFLESLCRQLPDRRIGPISKAPTQAA